MKVWSELEFGVLRVILLTPGTPGTLGTPGT
jgi:hypothetical protein